SLMIGLGLAHPAEGFDVIEMTMYQTLLARAATLVLCDNLAVARPIAADAEEADEVHEASGMHGASGVPSDSAELLVAIQRDLERLEHATELDGMGSRALLSAKRGLATLVNECDVGEVLRNADALDLAELLSILPRGKSAEGEGTLSEGGGGAPGGSHEQVLRHRVLATDYDDQSEIRLAQFFARRFHRIAKRRKPLMGPLYERLPQPLPLASERRTR
ncbi:MAG: hypothetical protein AB8G23_24295, partial [Myxococcota bacterium]